jgi:hypothetical protein
MISATRSTPGAHIDHVTYLAGVISEGSNGTFGDSNDVRLANAIVGTLSAPGGITNVFVEDSTQP